MFVLLLSIIFILSITRSLSTENNNTLLKNQLQKSLSHINDMLADIEGKIENERKILSQIDYDLNYKEETGFLDYDITDIWWQSTSHPLSAPTQTTQQTSVTTITTADVGGDIRTLTAATRLIPTASTTTSSIATTLNITETTISTTLTSPLIPKLLPSLPSSLPSNWPFSTTPDTTDTPFIADLKKVMAHDRYGYFTSFLAKFLEILATKDLENITPILKAFTTEVRAMLQGQRLKGLGEPLENNVKLTIEMMNMMSPATLRQQAGVGHYVMKNKNVLLSKEINAAFESYDMLFTKEEGEELFRSLELFDKYPDGGKSATEVTQSILNAVVAPFERLDGTPAQTRLIRNINQAIQEMYPNWRAHVHSSVDDLNHFSQGKNTSIVPLRRSMNYKKIMRHFLIKHPKLFKKLKRRHNHIKKKNHHHMVHKQRRHNFHRKHEKHGHLYEKLLKKRTHTIRSNEQENIVDSGASEAFYREGSISKELNHKKIKQKVKRLKTNKNHFHTRHRNIKPVQQHHRLYKPKATIKHPKTLNAKYLRELAIKFIRKKKNAKTFRRLNIETSENEMLNESVILPIVDNNALHKIREASSYSDEEDNLKTNLYDALRHGNRTYYQFRSNDANNQTLWDVSTESDDEWVIKNNIYKVFE